MSNLTIISCLLSVLWCYLGYKTITNGHGNRAHILFSVLCITMVFWTLFIGIGYSVKTVDGVILLLKISYTGGFLYSPVILHFFLEISRIKIRPYYLVLNYLPFIILIITNWADFFIFSSIIKYNNEWLGIINSGSMRMQFYIAALFIIYSASIAVLIKWNLKTASNKERIQSRLILIFFSISYMTSYILTLILPLFGISEYQFIGVAIFDFFIIGLYFLVSRFRFMNLKGTLKSDEIISHISEFVFVLDNDLMIVECNTGAGLLCNGPDGKLRKRSFTDIIIDNGDFSSSIKSVVACEIKNFTTIISYKTESQPIHARAYVSGIKDRFRDNSGILVISSEIKDVLKFQKTFGITGRELEITALVVSGSTYKEISDKLGISERTVERHLTNIYNKLGINNKIELYRIAEGYNIRI